MAIVVVIIIIPNCARTRRTNKEAIRTKNRRDCRIVGCCPSPRLPASSSPDGSICIVVVGGGGGGAVFIQVLKEENKQSVSQLMMMMMTKKKKKKTR